MKVVLQNLTKIFPNRKKGGDDVVAVNDFSFEIPDGKLVGLLGPSGCGKSTSLYMICGLQKPTSGKIFFGDIDVTALEPESRGVGLVFQNYALYPHMTVKQNILYPLQNLKGSDKMTKEQMLERAVEVAKIVQIDELLERKPHELSGGQQQRVAIATVFVTHDQEEAMSISDMIVVMKKGVVQQIGAPQAVYDSPANLFVAKFLGTPPINVFEGEVKGGKVWIGEDAVADAEGIADRKVFVGIRPEGFILDPNGPLHCDLRAVEVMGRDVSVVSTNANCTAEQVRSIIDADQRKNMNGDVVRFAVKPNKIFIFDKENEERIVLPGQDKIAEAIEG